MRLTRAAASLVSIVLFAAPAFADVTMKMTMATAGGPASAETVSVTFIKGMKMRSDVKVAGQDMSVFVDVAAKQQLMVNNATKEVTDFGAMMANLPMTVGEVTVSVTPNGQKRSVLGRACEGYTVTYSMPMTMAGETLTIGSSGVVWIARDAPGAAEYLAFSRAAAAAGLTTGMFSQGPQAKAIAQVQAAMTEKGIPLEQEMQITITGTGQMAEMMSRSGAGNMKMTMKVTEISLDPIPAETFVIPGAAPKK
jgi:hypothetical protein